MKQKKNKCYKEIHINNRKPKEKKEGQQNKKKEE